MSDISKISKKTIEELEQLLSETGFELWNAGCTHRLSVNYSTDGWKISEYHNPLQAVKVYKNLNSALKYLLEKDER